MAPSDARKKKIWIIILVIVAAVVCIVSGVVFWKLRQADAAKSSGSVDAVKDEPASSTAILERLYRVSQLQNVSAADMLGEMTAILSVQLGKQPAPRRVQINTAHNQSTTFDPQEAPSTIVRQAPEPPVSVIVHDYGDNQGDAGDDW